MMLVGKTNDFDNMYLIIQGEEANKGVVDKEEGDREGQEAKEGEDFRIEAEADFRIEEVEDFRIEGEVEDFRIEEEEEDLTIEEEDKGVI